MKIKLKLTTAYRQMKCVDFFLEKSYCWFVFDPVLFNFYFLNSINLVFLSSQELNLIVQRILIRISFCSIQFFFMRKTERDLNQNIMRLLINTEWKFYYLSRQIFSIDIYSFAIFFKSTPNFTRRINQICWFVEFIKKTTGWKKKKSFKQLFNLTKFMFIRL